MSVVPSLSLTRLSLDNMFLCGILDDMNRFPPIIGTTTLGWWPSRSCFVLSSGSSLLQELICGSDTTSPLSVLDHAYVHTHVLHCICACAHPCLLQGLHLQLCVLCTESFPIKKICLRADFRVCVGGLSSSGELSPSSSGSCSSFGPL
uniref:Uncharacterized protein n=1 Tax=Zea mays TaxID=4577 RepID=A0A804UDS5_MAIZE